MAALLGRPERTASTGIGAGLQAAAAGPNAYPRCFPPDPGGCTMGLGHPGKMNVLSRCGPWRVLRFLARRWKAAAAACVLLAAIVLPRVPLTWGMTALHLVASHGLITADFGGTGPNICCSGRWDGRVPTGPPGTTRARVAEARLLLAIGADPNFRDSDGWTPLHWACWLGDPRLAALLLTHGADPAARAYDMDPGMATTDIAGGRPDSPWQQRAKRSRSTPFGCLMGGDRVGIARMLLDHGFDLSSSDTWGSTVLHESAWSGAPRIAQLLLDRGADARRPDSDGWTPLHSAAFSGSAAVAEALVRSGASVDDRTTHMKTIPAPPGAFFIPAGSTPLSVAVDLGRWGAVRALVKAGADPEIADSNGQTPLSRIRSRSEAPADIVAVMSRRAKDRDLLTLHGKR